MKKTLLTLGLALTFGATFAQDTFVIWNGTDSAAAHSIPAVLGGATVDKDTFALAGDTLFYLSVAGTSVSYYAGGVGVATFSSPGVATSLGYSGSVANTTVKYKITTFGSPSPVSIRLDFKTTTGSTYGYEKTFTTPIAPGFEEASIPLSSFKLVNTSDGTFSTPFADTALAVTTSEVQFVASTKANTGNGDIAFSVADLVLESSIPLGVDDANIAADNFAVYPNPNNIGVLNLGENARNYTLSNISGSVVKTGIDNKVNVEGLDKGIYFIRVGNKTTKVILN